MPTLTAWAAKYNIDPAAILDLRMRLIGEYDWKPAGKEPPLSEAAVQNNIRLEATHRGDRLFRNNVGAGKLAESGTFVRFGLANDSQAINHKIKSGDLIGIKRVVITSAHVGQTIGQFWSVEAKHQGWKYTGTEREQAQLKWAQLVVALGGCAHFSTGAI